MDFSSLEDRLAPQLKSRWDALVEHFCQMKTAAVAFSGGVDSGLLCAAAYRSLGECMLAVTVRSPVETLDNVHSAQGLAEQVGFRLQIVDYDDLSNPEFVANCPDRCYTCKLARFCLLRQLADENGLAELVEGSNVDDLADYRPGRRAIAEVGVKSPLQELGFRKDEIRTLAHAFGLSVWNRPSSPCLATRFPYGSPVTYEGLRQVEAGEHYLQKLGFQLVRVRHHGTLARLEVAAPEIERLAALREQISVYFKGLGFTHVAVDLNGYRTGSLNEVLK
jgi:uncharacterized protein